jgi:CRISPR/Cas system-associated endoribonuclease Cas2
MLITWESRNWRKFKKATELCKNYGLIALSKKLFIGNIKKNEMPEIQQSLKELFVSSTDRLFVFMICKSCLEVSTIPEAIQANIVQPLKYEIA